MIIVVLIINDDFGIIMHHIPRMCHPLFFFLPFNKFTEAFKCQFDRIYCLPSMLCRTISAGLVWEFLAPHTVKNGVLRYTLIGVVEEV